MRASSLPSPPSKEGGGQIEIATTIAPNPILKLTEKANKANKLPRARSGPPSKEQGSQIEIATTITPKPILKLTEKSNRAYKLLRARAGPPSKEQGC